MMIGLPHNLVSIMKTAQQIQRMQEPLLRTAEAALSRLTLPTIRIPGLEQLNTQVAQQMARHTAGLERALVDAAQAADLIERIQLNLDPLAKAGQHLAQVLEAIDWRRMLDSISHWVRQAPLWAALRAREAVLEGDQEVVAAFIYDWLRVRPTAGRVEAMEMALLEDGGFHLSPEQIILHLRMRAARYLRGLRLMGETQLSGHPIDSLDRLVRVGDTWRPLADRVSVPDPVPALIERLYAEQQLQTLRGWFTDQELRVIRRHHNGWSWAAAATAEGLPSEKGDHIRRKLSRLAHGN